MIQKTLSILTVAALVQGVAAKGCAGDSDWDGLTDDVDNCVSVYNPAQVDEDADGMGDACDTATPYHDLLVDGCYFSNYPPLKGVNWEDRPTFIQQGDVDPTSLYVKIDWTASDSQWIEYGEGTTDGGDVWFDIRDEHNPYLFTRTIVEAVGADTTGDGKADELLGTYVMLSCESNNDSTYCFLGGDDAYEVFSTGDFNATRVNSLECNF